MSRWPFGCYWGILGSRRNRGQKSATHHQHCEAVRQNRGPWMRHLRRGRGPRSKLGSCEIRAAIGRIEGHGARACLRGQVLDDRKIRACWHPPRSASLRRWTRTPACLSHRRQRHPGPSPIVGVASTLPVSASTTAIFFPSQTENRWRLLRSMASPDGESQAGHSAVTFCAFASRRTISFLSSMLS